MILRFDNWGYLGPHGGKTLHDLLADLKNNPSTTHLLLFIAEEVITDSLNNRKNLINLIKYCKRHNIEPYVVVNVFDTNHYDTLLFKFFKARSWPTFFLNHIYRLTRRSDTPLRTNITHPFISMNNKAHYHRCLLMDIFAKHNLIDLGKISWHCGEYVNYKWRYWKDVKKIQLDESFDSAQPWSHYPSPPPAFYSSLVSIVAESVNTHLFLTEKTFICILKKQPFIILGCKGIHQHLTQFGFKLYTELFDYSFDNEENLETRCESIAENIKRIIGIDYNQAREQMNDTIEFNYNRAMEIIDNKLYIPDIMKDYVHQTGDMYSANWCYHQYIPYKNLDKLIQ